MNETPSPIILEVEGMLEDVLAEVFRKRVYPMLNAAPTGDVRLVVTTQPDLFRGGREAGEAFFSQGGTDQEPAFTWKRTASLGEAVQLFRSEFLAGLDVRALSRHVLFGIYNADFKPAPEPAVEAAPEEEPKAEDGGEKPGESESAPADAAPEKPWWDDSMAPDAPPFEYIPATAIDPAAPKMAAPEPKQPEAAVAPQEAAEPVQASAPEPLAESEEKQEEPQAAQAVAAPVELDKPAEDHAGVAAAEQEGAAAENAELAPDEQPPMASAEAAEPLAESPAPLLYAEPLLLAPARARAFGGDYLEFFGLAAPPFSGDLDLRHLFPTRRRREILRSLLNAVTERRGGSLVTGVRGGGKTTLGRELLGQLPELIQGGTVRATEQMTPTPLLRAIAAGLGQECEGLGRPALLECIVRIARERQEASGAICILIDDAERLEADALETLRQLLEMEEAELRIVLLGQPELSQTLARRELRGLRQRILAQHQLPAFTPAETAQYIEHRLALAQPEKGLNFIQGAMGAAWHYSGGAARAVNELCERALRAACVDHERRITRGRIREAARALEMRPPGGPLARFFQFW